MTRNTTRGERVELLVTCSGVDAGGAGVAHVEGLTLHVAGALPGERVRVSIEHVSPHSRARAQRANPTASPFPNTRAGAREAWGRVGALESASPDRVAPACAAYGRCGGCVLQHWSYAEQVAWKGARLGEELHRLPELRSVTIEPCVPSPEPLGYRNQAKLVYTRDSQDRPVLGAFAPRSHEIVDLAGCRVVEPVLEEVSGALRALLADEPVAPYDETEGRGLLRYVVMRANAAGEVLVALVTASAEFPRGPAIAKALRARAPAVVGVVQNVNPTRGNVIFGSEDIPLDGAMAIDDEIAGVRVRLSPRAFLQVNRGVAALAYAKIRDAVAALAPVGTVADVFAGVGGIGLSLAPFAARVVLIEENARAAEDARTSATRAGLGAVSVVAADAAAGLRALEGADVVVLNPPRAGCAAGVLREVARLAPRLVAYLSCNPATLARDLAVLGAHGLAATTVTPLDMHPHTPHVEALALLHPRK